MIPLPAPPIPFQALGLPTGEWSRLGLNEKIELLQPPEIRRTWTRKPIVLRAPGPGMDKLRVSWSASGPAITRMPALNGVRAGETQFEIHLQHMIEAYIPVGQTSMTLDRPVVPGTSPIGSLYSVGGVRVPLTRVGQVVSIPAPNADLVMVSYKPVLTAILKTWTSSAQFDATQPWTLEWEEV